MNRKTQSTTPSLKSWNYKGHSRSEEVTGHLWCLPCLWVHIQDWGIHVLGRSDWFSVRSSRNVPSRNAPWWTTDPHRNRDSIEEYFKITQCFVSEWQWVVDLWWLWQNHETLQPAGRITEVCSREPSLGHSSAPEWRSVLRSAERALASARERSPVEQEKPTS